MEVLQSSMHGDWTWRSGISCAVPSAETGNNPGCPGQRSSLERISQTFGSAINGWSNGFEYSHVFEPQGCGCGPLVSAMTGMNKLHADDRGAQRNDGEFAQNGWGFDLAFLEAETLALHSSEELLDVPASTIVRDGLMCRRAALDWGA